MIIDGNLRSVWNEANVLNFKVLLIEGAEKNNRERDVGCSCSAPVDLASNYTPWKQLPN